VRIAIDARKLHDFGIGTYIRNLLKYLAILDRETEYILLCRPQDVNVVDRLGPNFRAVAESSRPYSLAEQVMLPARLLTQNVSLFHEPHYVLPPLVPCRAVVTIHDCIHLMFPQYLPNRLAYGYARANLWAAAKRAERILTVVATCRSQGRALLGYLRDVLVAHDRGEAIPSLLRASAGEPRCHGPP